MKILSALALIALGLTLSGCATIIKGTTQSVSITSAPTQGAMCELKNSEGVWYVTTPGSVTVHKTKNDLTVTCSKVGFQDGVVTIPAKFNAVTAGNILAGGLIGIGVDAASGANYGYPESTEVPLVPIDGAVTPVSTTPDMNEEKRPLS